MNKQTQLLSVVLAIGSLLLLSGCANYKAMSLPKLARHADSAENSKNKTVTLDHKVFTKANCKTYLGRKNILKKGYQPIQLVITNNTDHTYTYSASSLSLPVKPVKEVINTIKFSSRGRGLGYSAAGTVCAGAAVPLGITAIHCCTAACCCLCAAFGMIVFGIPTAVLGITSLGFYATSIIDCRQAKKANKALSNDYATKSFPEAGTLLSGQIVDGIVFVPKAAFKDEFTFTINDRQNNNAVVLNSTSKHPNIK
jgi:hypothetical protein